MKKEQYSISGMSCAACSASVQRVVSRLDGVAECDVNLITGKMFVSYDETKTGQNDFVRVVEKAGFGIDADNSSDNIKEQKNDSKKEKNGTLSIITAAVLSALLLYISMGQMFFKNLPVPFFTDMNKDPQNFALTQLLLCIPVIFIGKKFFTNGIPLLLRGHPNMDSLVAIGAGASFIYSLVMTYTVGYNRHAVHNLYYESVAVVITLVMLGKHLEQRSKSKTADAIRLLMELAPDTATVVRDGNKYTVPTAEVKKGDIIVVKAGAKFPLDGIVTDGSGSADESMLTGESVPVYKEKGSFVYGGSINLNGVIFFEVKNESKDTALSKIIKFVEDAQSKKAPISKTADRVAGIFVPVVIVIAVLAALAWLISGKDIAFSLRVFTGVLVIACPCALGLATPTAIMVGTGLGASNGILIRNGEVLETAHSIKAAVFDKTGTVTVGKAVVTDITAEDSNRLIKTAAEVEAASDHPLAKAITDYADKNNIRLENKPQDFKNLAGKGIECTLNGNKILIGKAAFMEENSVDIGLYREKSELLSSEGKSIVFVAENNAVLGLIAVADELKPTSKDAFARLKKMGIATVLLSGDNRLCAEHIGKQLDADEVFSEVLPQEKAEKIAEIRKKHGAVMMIGDGINDAPALSEADVGCAIGSGSDIAIEAADIVLMKSDPCDVARAVRLSRLTITNIKQNLFWAFCYNTVCIPIAAGLLYIFGGPLLSPMLAGLAMSLSSVFVVGNALRLRGKKL